MFITALNERKMSHAASRIETGASRSPLLGDDSIFVDRMVTKSGEVSIVDIRKYFRDTTYTLNDLTQYDPQGSNEADAQRWIVSMLGQDSSFSTLRSNGLPHLSALAPFHSTRLIKPDVCVVTSGTIPVFTVDVEVYSETYEQTVKKAVLGAIAHLRLLRARNSQAESCIAFAFPGNMQRQKSFVTKVTVSFVNFGFQYTFLPLGKNDVKPAIGEILRQDWSTFYGTPDFSYFIHLSQEECDVFESGAVQVNSFTSLVIRNRDSTKYWKFNVKATMEFVSLETIQAVRIELNAGSYLQQSLLHSSISQQGGRIFYQYEGLKPPLSRQEAKSHLLALVEGVRVALDELHRQSVAHMDVRLPNICFTHTSPSCVKLIDLDRCEPSFLITDAYHRYAESDMYSPRNSTWQNDQLDWKALGMIICFVLDDEVDEKDYHRMISDGKVTNGVDRLPFVKSLLEEGEWNDATSRDFWTQYQHGHNSPL